MSNMSYCRFHNTASDLRDCYEHMHGKLEDRGYDSEYAKRRKLIELCIRIAREFGVVDDDGMLTGEIVPEAEWEYDEEDEE